MEQNEKDLIEKLKILIIYGKKEVDGKNKDGVIEKIYKEEEDAPHYFYIKDFLKTNLTSDKNIQEALSNGQGSNGIFYEIKNSGHIVFIENTSYPEFKTGIFLCPKQFLISKENL